MLVHRCEARSRDITVRPGPGIPAAIYRCQVLYQPVVVRPTECAQVEYTDALRIVVGPALVRLVTLRADNVRLNRGNVASLFHHPLSIETSIEIYFESQTESIYLLQRSRDLQLWETIETIEGNGTEVRRFFTTRDGESQYFYRVFTNNPEP